MHRLGLRLEEIFAFRTRAKTRKIFETQTRFWDQVRGIERVESVLPLFLRVLINSNLTIKRN